MNLDKLCHYLQQVQRSRRAPGLLEATGSRQLQDKLGGGARLNKHHLCSAAPGSAGSTAQQQREAGPAARPRPSPHTARLQPRPRTGRRAPAGGCPAPGPALAPYAGHLRWPGPASALWRGGCHGAQVLNAIVPRAEIHLQAASSSEEVGEAVTAFASPPPICTAAAPFCLQYLPPPIPPKAWQRAWAA